MDHRALSELGDEPVGVELGRRHVEAHPDAVLVGELPAPPATADRCTWCGRPGSTTRRSGRRRRDAQVVELALEVARSPRRWSGGRRPARAAGPTPNARRGPGCRPRPARRPPRRGSGSCPPRGTSSCPTGASRPRPAAPRAAPRRRVYDRVQRAQPHEHVLLERRVVGDVAAGQRLAGDVDVGVDHPGRDDEALAAAIARRRDAWPRSRPSCRRRRSGRRRPRPRRGG